MPKNMPKNIPDKMPDKYKLLLQKAGTYVLSAAFGAGAATICLLAFGALIHVLGLPPDVSGICALLSFGAGCFVSGLVCGAVKKRGGLRHGFRCAVIMCSFVMVGAALCGTLNGTDAIAKTVTAVLTGCGGGVAGVNLRR